MIPYLICLVLAGVPILILEVSLGQFQGQGGITAWKIVPLFQGNLIFFLICLLLTAFIIQLKLKIYQHCCAKLSTKQYFWRAVSPRVGDWGGWEICTGVP